MRAEIQDSDEEFDSASEASFGKDDNGGENASGPALDSASTDHSASNGNPSLPETVTTGIDPSDISILPDRLLKAPDQLAQDIQAAHRDMLGSSKKPTPHKTTLLFETDNTDSPMLPPSKRRRTEQYDSHSPPENKPQRRKTTVTYGKAEQRVAARSDGMDAFEAFKNDVGRDSRVRDVESFPGTDGGHSIHDGTSGWELPATIAEDFAQHEPVSMFPDASSTIPDNTMSQQRMLEEAMYARQTPEEPLHKSPVPAKSSIPWSTYITSPSTKGDPTPPEPQLSPFHEFLRADPLKTTSEPAKADGIEIHTIAPVDDITFPGEEDILLPEDEDYHRLSQADSVDELSSGHVVSRKEALQGKEGKKKPESVPGKLKSTKKTKRPVEEDYDLEESVTVHTASKDVVEDGMAVDETKSRKPRKAHNHDPLPSDDLFSDLSKETYVPKPTRSRGSRVQLNDDIDYSVIPERAMKAKINRRKTTGSVGRGIPTPSEKAEMICSMGFTSSQADKALGACDGIVDVAVDWLCNDGLSSAKPGASRLNPESVEPVSLKPTRNGESPQKRSELPESPRRNHEKASPQRGGLMYVEIPVAEEIQVNVGASEVQVTTDDPQEPANPTEPVHPPSNAKEKKRGRGRPRKVVIESPVVVPIEEVDDSIIPVDLDQGTEEQQQQQPPPPAEEEQMPTPSVEKESANADPPPSTPPKEKNNSSNSTKGGAKNGTTDEAAPPVSRKPASPSHSPLSKGKVPYRVGLSRKARIAPLLKIVRK